MILEFKKIQEENFFRDNKMKLALAEPDEGNTLAEPDEESTSYSSDPKPIIMIINAKNFSDVVTFVHVWVSH